jgi:hypothetical protein
MPQVSSADGTLGRDWKTESYDDYDFSSDEEGFWPVSRLRQQYIDYLTAKVPEYEEQRQARHYMHGAQWTPEEIEVLRKRRQPIVTFNRIGRKIDSIVGMVQRLRQDPKAYPKNPRNADGAEIATQAVRSVLEANEWQFLDPYCAGQAGIEGIGGVELKLIEGDHEDPDVGMDFVYGDDWFYDPRSRKPDFSDCRYHGLAKWLDVEAAIELFPDREEELRTLMVETGFDLTTHADIEFKWIYVNEKRLRLVEHWYRHKGKWYWAFYCSMILLAQGVSPFLDERNKPMSRFIMFSAAVDHDGDRYGFVRNLKGPQDELNQRRSKALFMSNVTRLIAQKGAVDSVETARREYARPDGYVEFNMGFDPPKPDDTAADLAQQLALMQDARQEIDSFVNINPALMGQEVDTHSGVAINLLQKAGIAELGTFLRNYRAWKIRVYKAIWNITQRTWTKERYLRISDNQNFAQFLQINGIDRDEWGQPILDEWGQPTLINFIGNLNVEITMDEGPDVENLMQDTYNSIKDDPTIPWQIKLEFMPLPSTFKKNIEQKLAQASQAQTAQQKGQIDIQKAQIDAQAAQQKSQAETAVAHMAAQAEITNAQQDALARQQDAQLQREKAQAEREQIRMEMAQAAADHAYKMRELAAQHETRQAEHAARRQAIKSKPKQSEARI